MPRHIDPRDFLNLAPADLSSAKEAPKLSTAMEQLECALFSLISLLRRSAMKRRHAVAFAVVGWYLMLPPVDNKLNSQTGRPLYYWHLTEETFSSLKECEVRKAALKHSYLDEAKKQSGNLGKEFLKFSENVDKGQCVKSDDPRFSKPE